MSYFAVTYVYGSAEEQAKHRPEHRAYLSKLVEQGTLAASGPFITGEEPGALLIFRAGSSEEVNSYIAQDPMNTGGAVLSHTVREWNPVLGQVGI